jgi:DNA-binding response OmpR family regulator
LWVAEKELAEKDRELRERLQNLVIDGELPPVSLVFDENTLTTRWDGGSVKLSEIPFKFFKALHDASDRQLSWNDIEAKVWGESKDGAIHTTASRLRTALKKHKCPLRLVSLNRKTWIPDEEYQEDQNRPSPTMKTTTGFRLE